MSQDLLDARVPTSASALTTAVGRFSLRQPPQCTVRGLTGQPRHVLDECDGAWSADGCGVAELSSSRAALPKHDAPSSVVLLTARMQAGVGDARSEATTRPDRSVISVEDRALIRRAAAAAGGAGSRSRQGHRGPTVASDRSPKYEGKPAPTSFTRFEAGCEQS